MSGLPWISLDFVPTCFCCSLCIFRGIPWVPLSDDSAHLWISCRPRVFCFFFTKKNYGSRCCRSCYSHFWWKKISSYRLSNNFYGQSKERITIIIDWTRFWAQTKVFVCCLVNLNCVRRKCLVYKSTFYQHFFIGRGEGSIQITNYISHTRM